MKKTHKIISILLVIAMMLTMAPILVFAAETVASGTCGTDVSYVLNSDGVLTVSGSGAMTNYRFAGQVPYYAYLEDIKTVIIEDGVTSVGTYAFRGCTNLTSLEIKGTLDKISKYAFYGCSSMTEITYLSTTVPDFADGTSTFTASGIKVTVPEGYPIDNFAGLTDLSYTASTGSGETTLPTYAVTIFQRNTGVAVKTVTSDGVVAEEATYGKDLTVELEITGEGTLDEVYVHHIYIGDNRFDLGDEDCPVTLNELTLTIPGEYVTEKIKIDAGIMLKVSVDMAGGYLKNTYSTQWNDPVDGVVTMTKEWARYGVGGMWYFEEDFAREGYILADMIDSEGNSYAPNYQLVLSKDLELTLVWEECTKHNYIDGLCVHCGKADHTHSFKYTAGGSRIVATCVADDCTLENGIGGTLTISAPAELYADGTTAKEATVENNLVDTSVAVDITYSTADGNAPKTAGTYTASVTVGGATATVKFTLVKPNASVSTVPVANALTYNREAQALVTAGSSSDGEIQYSLDGATYSSDIPAATNAGDYTVYYKVIGDENHNDSEPATVTVTISPANIYDATVTQVNPLYYNGTMQYVELAVSFDGKTLVYMTDYFLVGRAGGTDAGTYNTTVIGQGNYKGEKTIEWYIEKATPTADMLVFTAPENLTYDGSEKSATVEASPEITGMGEITVKYSATPVNAGTYTVSIDVAEGSNYNAISDLEIGEFTIIKADNTVTAAPTPKTLTYNGEEQNLISEGSSESGTVVYSLDGAEYSETIPTGTNAGEYTIYYKVEGDSNHNDSEPETITVTIKAKDISDGFIILGDALTYNGKEQTQTVAEFVISADLEVTYTVSGNKATNVGVYLLTVTGTGNFTGEAMLTFEIAPDTSKIDALTVDNVTSANKADVESVKAQIDNASTEYASYETKAEYNAIAEKCVELLAVIGDTADEIKRITDAVNTYDIDTVTGDDVPALVQLAQDTDALLSTDNLTAEEIEALVQTGKDIQALISRCDRISAQIGDIIDRMLAYDEATVKSSDKVDIEKLVADIKDLTDGQNITAAEREYLVNADAECDKLLAKIAETSAEYNRLIAAANGYDEATVTSADKDALVQLNEDIYALALTENVTAEEKENLQAAHDKVFALIDKLVGISDEIKRITEKVDAYVFESVKSSDKADIQQLIADIKALLDTQNLTADERTILETADETCDKLIAKIDETVAEIKRINNATNAYDEATVTSADKEAIEQLIADIKALTDGDNITESEREQLIAVDETLDELLAKINATADEIERIEEAVNGYDEETVKSTDKADLEQLKADIKALTDATNITEDERAKLGNLDATLDSLIKKIDDTASEIARIDEAVNSYDMETVTSADIPALGKLIDDIRALTDGQNITDDEKAALEANDEAIDELVEKLTEVAEEIKRVDEAVKSYDEATVKSTDKADLEQLKEDIQALIDSTNTTENEKTALDEMIEKVNALLDKISETEEKLEEIKGIENNFNPENVSSDDKAAIEEKIAEIESVNPDNLTEEQKAEYDEIKAGFEALLEEIEKAGSEVDAIGAELEMFDEERVTIFWEDEIEALKAKIDELLADENMGEAEKAKLNEYKAQCDNLIEIINNPSDYFSMRLFHFVWDALHWLSSHVVFIFNWIVAMF